MADGSRHSMYLVEEATNNVTPATPAWDEMRITGTTLGLSKDSLQSGEIRKDRQISDFRLGANQVQGEINFELSYGTFDKLLESALMGTWDVDNPVAGTDTLSVGTDRKSFSFLRQFEDIQDKPFFLYTGCEINTLSLAISANAMITGTMSIVGRSQSISATAPASSTFNAPTTTAAMDSFTGTLDEGGATIAVITEITLQLENGLAPRFVVGSKDSILPSSGRSNLTGSITAYFESAALAEKFVNETESSISFDMPDADGNLQTHVIPRIKYTGGQPDISGEGPVTLNMPFQALLDEATGTNYYIERTPV